MAIIAQETLTEAFTNANGTFYFSDLSIGGSELDNPNTAAYVPCFFTGGAGILTQLQGAGNGTLSMYAEGDYNTLLASWTVEPTAGLEAYPVFMHVLALIQSGSNITLGNNYSFTLAISDGYPNQSDVRAGVLYGPNNSLNGTLTIPPVAKVSSGYGYGNNGTEYTGNLTIPGVAKVKSGTAYGENSALTGNLTLPGINQTLNGTLYGENSALTGVLRVPAAGDVRSGTGFGANGTQYTGTLDPGNGTTIIRREEVMALNLYPQFDLQAGTGGNLTLPSIPDGALGAFIVPVGGNITWRGDGGNAATAGSLLPDGSGKAIYNLSKFRWCGGNGTMNLTIQWLRSPID